MRRVVILLGFAGCFAPTVQEGAPCAPNGDCPSGLKCDSTNTCVRDPAEGSPDASSTVCDPGFAFDGTSCVDIDECAAGPCSTDGACANQPGTFACACNPGFTGDGVSCARVCTSVLIYDDCAASDGDCAATPETLFADNAAQGLGLQVKYGGISDEDDFRTLFDAGGFELVIFESSLSDIEGATANRVASWVNGGGKAIVSFWDLDNGSTGQTIRNALQVRTVGEITNPPDLHRDPASLVNLFDHLEQLPSPIALTDPMIDDGDELELDGAGFIAARHNSPTGAGAIAVTRGDQVITLGFVPFGMVFNGPEDADNDGKPDVTELYTNLIGKLCGF